MSVGSMRMMRQQVASTATGSAPATIAPTCFGVPWMGPLPSMPTMPSTMAKVRGNNPCRSAMHSWIPAQCSTFLGQPYTAPGTRPNRFFMLSVAPTQWWHFILGMETSRSAESAVRGR